MRLKAIDPAGFEALFQKDNDPWNYTGSAFEAFKRRILIRACGTRVFGRGLELACANGETTRCLARLCLRLHAIDASPTVIAEARRRVPEPHVSFEVARLPDETPRGPFDLIVASEILYYLPRRRMDELLERLQQSLSAGGRLVLLHHMVSFDDAAQHPWQAQALARGRLSRTLTPLKVERHRRFEVAAFTRS